MEVKSNGLNFQESISDMTEKVRKMVFMFCRSPLKNETRKKCIHRDFKRELNLILDSEMEQLANYSGKVCRGGEMYQNGSH